MRLHLHHPHVPMPEASIRLSRVMLKTADAIESAIESFDDEDSDLVKHLVLDHLPPVLVEKAGDRLWTTTPGRYLKWIMAKSLAARIVYREGFEFLAEMPSQAIAGLAMRFLRLEEERRALIGEVDHSNLPSRQRISELLGDAGILNTMD